MQVKEGVIIALSSIWDNKLRSFFTLLGNIIAVASIIIVVSMVQGMDAKVAEIFTRRGADVFYIRKSEPSFSHREERESRYNPDLTMEDAEAIKKRCPSVGVVVSAQNESGNVRYREILLENIWISGRSWQYSFVENMEIEEGRHFSEHEDLRARNVAVIGSDIKDKLFKGANPIGKDIYIKGRKFKVIGLVKKRGMLLGNSQDEFVAIPISVFRKIFGSHSDSFYMMVKPKSPDLLNKAMEEAMVVMRVRHKLKPKQDNDFGIFTSDAFINMYQNATRGIYSALVGIVSLALIVGGVVIMNIMLMVVTERTREIGIRKAIGAKRRDVLWQFLVESLTLSMVGGATGIAIGIILAIVIANLVDMPYMIKVWSIIISLATVFIVGIIFGLYPANKAAKLDPIEALRYE
jgi:putative ABC transport system permease protein